MSSEAAQPELVNGASLSDAPVTNGDQQRQQESIMANDQGANIAAFEDNSALPIDQSEVTTDPQPTPHKPVEDVAPGITSVADFLPASKDASTSHPTPPPDEPLVSAEANVDVEMTEAEFPEVGTTSAPEGVLDVASTLEGESVPVPAPAPVVESSLVRPREEDDGEEAEEPVAKRSRFDGLDESGAEDVSLPIADAIEPEPEPEPQQQEQSATFTDAAAPVEVFSANPLSGIDAPLGTQASTQPAAPDAQGSMQHAAPERQASIPQAAPSEAPQPAPAPSTAVNGTFPEVDAEPTIEPIESIRSHSAPTVEDTANPFAETLQPLPTSVSAPAEPSASTQPQPLSNSDPAPANPSSTSAAPAQATAQYSTKPMTAPQKAFLQEKMKNLKKTKNSAPFSQPVDFVALNIPSYPEIIKQPMDLGTMDQKLKAGQYATVQEFADDFDLIVNNTRTFNGSAHTVTQMALSMEAYFRRMMESVPSADLPVLPKKKASPKPATNVAQRREPRAVPPPVSAAESFALQSNGTPQIRRESSTNRPARAIKPPPAKELAYAMPKRKEHQLELKFAEHVLQQIRGPQYAAHNSVFLSPVDPVALNIPNYRQVIKHPMDLGTMTQKMKQGQYGKASEVKKDFDLMIENCISFNPVGNPVRDMGISLQRSFESLWREKDKWEKKERANAKRGESSAEEESEEEEDEEEDDAHDEKTQTIRALQKQLMDMQNALAGLNAPAAKKTKKPKALKQGGTKKSGGASKAKLPPAKVSKAPKKTKIVTYEEKQEISEAVGNMNAAQVEQLTNIITSNCKKYAEQEEMELEIDDLPNEVQALLLAYVRSIFGNPNKRNRQISPEDAGGVMDEDDEFEPSERGKRGGAGGKRKKHRPMGKKEQQDAISNLQKQLEQFDGGQSVGAGYAKQAQNGDSSGDEESEESEEE